MTEILMAILMIAIGTITLIGWGDWMVFIFSLMAGINFLYDIVKEIKDGEAYR